MPGSQIPTAVTILNSLKGFQAISLTEYNTSAAAAVAAGSVVEIAGAYFTFLVDEAINASSWTAITTGTTAYITLAPSGTAGSQIVDVAYTSTAPTWRDDFQGWYASAASNVRVIGSVYKAEATRYIPKYILDTTQDYRMRGVIERITSGSGNWTVPAGVTRIRVTCVGGGGGGGAGASAGGVPNIGGGGGGGNPVEYCYATSVNVIPGSLIAYSVGAGGVGGSAASTTGTAGGNTTFAGATTGTGGTGGVGGSAAAGGGIGGSGIDDGSPGSVGGANTFGGSGGNGGGAGGAGGARSNSATNGGNGDYGGGGGGGGGVNGIGGAGGSGIIIIEY